MCILTANMESTDDNDDNDNDNNDDKNDDAGHDEQSMLVLGSLFDKPNEPKSHEKDYIDQLKFLLALINYSCVL